MKEDEALIEALKQFAPKPAPADTAKPAVLNGICRCVVENATPPSLGAVIVAAGVNFYYVDGGSDVDGPRQVNLGAGQNAGFMSKKVSGCVNKVFVAYQITVGDESGPLTDQSDPIGPNECINAAGFKLVLKSVSKPGESMLSRFKLERI